MLFRNSRRFGRERANSRPQFNRQTFPDAVEQGHALFLPTSREAKYKAKAAIDTFFWRVGDLAQAGVVLLGAYMGLSTQQFAWIDIALVLVWLVVVAGIYREHRKLAQA